VFGLALSIPLVVWGSKIVLTLLNRFKWLIIAGGGLLGYLAGEMIQTDPALRDFWSVSLALPAHALSLAGVVLVVAIGSFITWKAKRQAT
jgi:predicted tellurium resistance membrane protein TerC